MILPAAESNKSFLKGEPERYIQCSSHKARAGGAAFSETEVQAESIISLLSPPPYASRHRWPPYLSFHQPD